MRFKTLLTLLVAGVLGVTAQTQGYRDGIEYYKAGKYDNAITILERTLNEPGTDKALASYYLGQAALAQNKPEDAARYFEQGMSLDPENPYNYVGAGALKLASNNEAGAKDDFKEAQKLAKKNAEISVAIARAYYNADPVKYAQEIERALIKARKDSKNANPSIYVLEGDMLTDKENYGDAAARYEMAITYEPNTPEGYVKFANAYFNVNKDFGIRKLEEYLASHPESALVQRELADKYFQADRWRAASELYGRYIQNPNHFPEDRARYAVLLYWGEDYPQSLSIAEEILAQQPDNFLMQRIRFLDQEAMGNHEAAIANAQRFFASNPDAHFTIKDYTTYADALAATGNDSLAVVQYETAVTKYPDNGDLLKNLSSFYARTRDHIKAAEAYDRYLQTQERPTLTDFFGMSGRYLNAAATATDSVQAKEMADRGIAYINRVIEGTSEVTPAMYQRLGHLYVAGNNKKPNAEAIAAYDQMVALLDRDPENMNPANPKNGLKLYAQAYAFHQAFASANHDDEAVELWGEKYNEIQNLLSGTQAE